MNKIKQYILSLSFVKEALLQAEIKAFPKAQKDVLDTMRDDLDAQAEELSKVKLASLLSVVDMNKIVTIDKVHGIVYIRGQKVEERRLINLKSEAEALSEFDLWHLLSETPKELAHRAMFVAGDSIDDMKKGRSMLYTLSSQQNIVDMFKSYKQSTVNKKM